MSSSVRLLAMLALHRLSSIRYSPIQDCDEVFNYWEPLYYLAHHFGFQTWEYVYGLRSWFFLVLHSIGRFVPLSFDTTMEFYATRLWIASWSFVATWIHYQSIKSKNSEISKCYLVFTLAPGYFISSSSLLPSTFGMIFLTFGYAFSLQHKIFLTVVSTTIAGIWGWPFCLFYGVGYIIHAAIDQQFIKNLGKMILFGLTSVFITIFITVLVDAQFYHEWVLAPWNLIRYNLFSEGGPELYGTEPWYFYIVNGILNFNIAFVFALFTLPLLLVDGLRSKTFTGWVGPSTCFYVWLAVFSIQPHKEERFMYVAYPLLCLNAAISFVISKNYLESILMYFRFKYWNLFVKVFQYGVLGVFLWLSMLRTITQYQYYGAPINVYSQLQHHQPPLGSIQNVCVGKEWYRFPSHYFIPTGMRLAFIPSQFRGLLPTYFETPSLDPTQFKSWKEYAIAIESMPRNYTTKPKHVNDMNQYEQDRFVYCIDVG